MGPTDVSEIEGFEAGVTLGTILSDFSLVWL